VQGCNGLAVSGFVRFAGILNRILTAILNGCALFVRQPVSVPLTGCGQSTLHRGLCMTELEEAELTTGQGRALSGHRTDRAYSGYHPAVAASVKRECLGQSEVAAQFANQLRHVLRRIWLTGAAMSSKD
jgi:hypothetical protein